MRRIEVGERGRDPLPALIVADAVIVIGSGASARVRLPATVARDTHVRLEETRWTALADVVVDGVLRAGGDTGTLGDLCTLTLGDYEVRVSRAAPDAMPSPPQRTESLARELVRGLLGVGAAPSLEYTSGRRELAPPESILVIGRGDEAGLVILDEELSREHAEIRRGWDGVTVRDLGSRNGTRLDGVRVTEPVALHDGARLELGKVALVFRDPAERHLAGPVATTSVSAVVTPARPPAPVARPSTMPIVVAATIAVLASVGLIWVLAT